MKKTILLLLSFYQVFTYGQATLEHVFNSPTGTGCLNSSLTYIVTGLDSIIYLNENYQVIKTISVTWPTVGNFEKASIESVYQNTTDGFVYYTSLGIDTPNYTEHSFLYREDGTQLLDLDSGFILISPGYYMGGDIYFQHEYYNSISIYSIPGSFCQTCKALCGSTGLVGLEQNNPGALEVFPNPSTKQATITYRLPQGINKGEIAIYTVEGQVIKKIPVTGSFGSISDNDEPAGAYIYKLSTTEGTVVEKHISIQ